MLTAITMMSKTFEITVVDPISSAEFEWLELKAVDEDVEVALNKSGRILLVDGFEDVYQLISFISQHEFIHDIGLIREVIEYEPQYEDEMLIEVEFE